MAKAIARTDRRLVRLRAAEPGDAEALSELRRQNEQAHARMVPGYFRAPAWEVIRPRPNPASTILVAEGAPAGPKTTLRPVLGYVGIRVVEAPPDPTIKAVRRVHVDEIVVDEDHRGSGIGTALMQAATAWARRRGAIELVLTVWSDNLAAEAFYERLGFCTVARVLRRGIDP